MISTAQVQEIQESQADAFLTRRLTIPALEEMLYEAVPILDHGFVRLIDYMGGDEAIVQAARVSYGRGTKKVSEDQGLINYLMRHRHSTPFEMCEIKVHVKMPIFIARQWLRHRTANVNEYSARYSILDNEFYSPSPEHLAAQATTNRQGRDATLSADKAARVLDILKSDAALCYAHYEEMLNEGIEGTQPTETEDQPIGLSRELARMNLPLSCYTQFYWKIDLHNLMHFLSLRADPHAQYEIRVYAFCLMEMMQKWVPLTYQAFVRYRLEGVHLSKEAFALIKKALKHAPLSFDQSGMSKGEWREFQQLFLEDRD